MKLHSSKEVNDKDAKFNVGDRVRTSKYNFFRKDTHQTGLKKFL